ncbi:MAG: hypothetical protein WCE62_09910 [Polyangiales bacterium]
MRKRLQASGERAALGCPAPPATAAFERIRAERRKPEIAKPIAQPVQRLTDAEPKPAGPACESVELGASAIVEPAFSGVDWYQDYDARHAADSREGRLVSMHSFDAPWDSWEMHPEGSELVVCTDGEMGVQIRAR